MPKPRRVRESQEPVWAVTETGLACCNRNVRQQQLKLEPKRNGNSDLKPSSGNYPVGHVFGPLLVFCGGHIEFRV